MYVYNVYKETLGTDVIFMLGNIHYTFDTEFS